MPGTPTSHDHHLIAGLSLAMYADIYSLRADGSFFHRGVRPGPDWHAHGTCRRKLFVLTAKGVTRVVIHKQRWKRREAITGLQRTCHSRPPDDLAQVWSCATIVLLSLFFWLDADSGLHTYEAPMEALDDFPSRRTTQRWMARAHPLGMATQQALRRALIERCEPRPLELLFEGGLPPPSTGCARRWSEPESVWQLGTGLTLAVHGSLHLHCPTPRLMAEARGRWHPSGQPFLI